MQEQVPVSSHSGISRPDVLTSVVDSQSSESKAQRYRQTLADLDSNLQDDELYTMAVTLCMKDVPQFNSLPTIAMKALITSKVPDAIMALEEKRKRDAEQKRIHEEETREKVEKDKKQKAEEERSEKITTLHKMLLKESGLGLTPVLIDAMIFFLKNPYNEENFNEFKQRLGETNKMLDNRYFMINNLVTPLTIDSVNKRLKNIDTKIASLEKWTAETDKQRETMTSVGDSISVASSFDTAPSTPRSTHSSRASVHRNLRRGTIDPRIQEDEEYDPEEYDPFAQNAKEYAIAQKKADSLSKAPLDKLIDFAQQHYQSEEVLQSLKEERQWRNQKGVTVLKRPEHTGHCPRGRELGRAETPALNPTDDTILLTSATQQATASVPPPTTQTEATSPMAVDTQDASGNLLTLPEDLPRTSSANESGNDVIGVEFKKLCKEMKSYLNRIAKRKKKRKSPSLNPIQHQRNKRKHNIAKKNTPNPVREVVNDVGDGAEDTIPAPDVNDPSVLRVIFQEMKDKASTAIVKKGEPLIPDYVWKEFEDHFVNDSYPTYENKGRFLCWHEDLKNANIDKNKNNKTKDLDCIPEYFNYFKGEASRSHFYYCKGITKDKKTEPEPDVKICLILVIVQDEVWKNYV